MRLADRPNFALAVGDMLEPAAAAMALRLRLETPHFHLWLAAVRAGQIFWEWVRQGQILGSSVWGVHFAMGGKIGLARPAWKAPLEPAR
jgi:hypothetical protein